MIIKFTIQGNVSTVYWPDDVSGAIELIQYIDEHIGYQVDKISIERK